MLNILDVDDECHKCHSVLRTLSRRTEITEETGLFPEQDICHRRQVKNQLPLLLVFPVGYSATENRKVHAACL